MRYQAYLLPQTLLTVAIRHCPFIVRPRKLPAAKGKGTVHLTLATCKSYICQKMTEWFRGVEQAGVPGPLPIPET